jgi:hypothetical protein
MLYLCYIYAIFKHNIFANQETPLAQRILVVATEGSPAYSRGSGGKEKVFCIKNI